MDKKIKKALKLFPQVLKFVLKFIVYSILVILSLLLIMIICLVGDEVPTDLGNGYEYYESVCETIGPAHIPYKVLGYDYNENFIVAVQQVRGKPIYSESLGEGITIGEVNMYYRKYPTYDHRYYWIINKNNATNTGPLIESRFIEACDSMGVPSQMVDKMLKVRKRVCI